MNISSKQTDNSRDPQSLRRHQTDNREQNVRLVHTYDIHHHDLHRRHDYLDLKFYENKIKTNFFSQYFISFDLILKLKDWPLVDILENQINLLLDVLLWI